MLRLLQTTDAHWALLCGERQQRPDDLLLPEGGIDDLPILQCLRRVAQNLRDAGSPHSYLILNGNEIVGLCGYKHPPKPDSSVEIGFGIAAARRKLGYATRALSLLLAQAARDQSVSTVLAETHIDNVASQHVLRRNGFAAFARRYDREEGDLIVWRAPASALARQNGIAGTTL